MTVAAIENPRAIALRPLALPAEHGAWSILLEPIALALAVVPSAAGALLAVAVVFAFLARHPLKLAAQDLARGRRYTRTDLCAWIAIGYAVPAVTLLVLSGARPLLPLAVAALFAAVQFVLDVRGRGRTLLAELCGTAGTSVVAAAIGGWPLAILAGGRTLPTTLFVRALRRRERIAMTIAAHVMAIVVVVILWRVRLGPVTAILAMSLLAARAVHGLRAGTPPPAKVIGLREVGWGAATIVLIAAGYIFQRGA